MTPAFLSRPVNLDWQNPIADTALSRGLAHAWCGLPHGGARLFDLAGGIHADVAQGWAPDPDAGWAIDYNSGTGTSTPAADFIGAGPFTILVMWKLHAFGGIGRQLLTIDDGGGSSIFLTVNPHSPDHLTFVWTDGSDFSGDIDAVADAILDQTQISAVTIGGDFTQRIYHDGGLVATRSDTTDLFPAGDGTLTIGASFLGRIPLVAIWRRELSAAEIAELTFDPWQLFRTPKSYGIVQGNPVSHYLRTSMGRSAAFNSFAKTERGRSKAGVDPYRREQRGRSMQTMPFGGTRRGAARTFNSFKRTDSGKHKSGYTSYSAESRGLHRAFNAFTRTDSGKHKSGYLPYARTERGASRCYAAYVRQERGQYRLVVTYTRSERGKSRAANAALARYELFRGVDGAPIDFTAAPYTTSSSLPFTTAVQTAGHTYQFVLRQRNAYNLSSQNLDAWTLTLDGSGNPVGLAPSAPMLVAVVPAAAGAIAITAKYLCDSDGVDQADHYLLYIKSAAGPGVPADPDPSIDTPVSVTMSKSGGMARLNYITTPFADGTNVKVLVRVRRTQTPDVDSINTDVHSATATTSGPAAVSGSGLFFADVDEQQQ